MSHITKEYISPSETLVVGGDLASTCAKNKLAPSLTCVNTSFIDTVCPTTPFNTKFYGRSHNPDSTALFISVVVLKSGQKGRKNEKLEGCQYKLNSYDSAFPPLHVTVLVIVPHSRCPASEQPDNEASSQTTRHPASKHVLPVEQPFCPRFPSSPLLLSLLTPWQNGRPWLYPDLSRQQPPQRQHNFHFSCLHVPVIQAVLITIFTEGKVVLPNPRPDLWVLLCHSLLAVMVMCHLLAKKVVLSERMSYWNIQC